MPAICAGRARVDKAPCAKLEASPGVSHRASLLLQHSRTLRYSIQGPCECIILEHEGCFACMQGRALLKKLEASPEWGQITAISRHPDPDLAGTRIKFLPLDLLDSEVRAPLSWLTSRGALLPGVSCWAHTSSSPRWSS